MMTAEIISGSDLANSIRGKIKNQISDLKQKNITPHLTVILIGQDPASESYVKGKEKASSEVGISSEIIRMPADTNEKKLLNKIGELNKDETVHGILVQLPLPANIDEQKVIEAIDPKKDVDGFHPINIGRMMVGRDAFLPCTPLGIIEMLKSKNIQIEGKHAVIIGRSNIVGKPMGQLLLNENATVTYCHSKTNNLQAFTQNADIVIVAMGKANAIDSTYIKPGAIVIDVGVNRTEEGMTGDVDFQDMKKKAAVLTPVPKGVGPMTITMLLANTIKAAKGLNED